MVFCSVRSDGVFAVVAPLLKHAYICLCTHRHDLCVWYNITAKNHHWPHVAQVRANDDYFKTGGGNE